ncbi:hypothetical protein CLOM_g23427 [Closterium sp. NIES-68]|nr:hypothetical protein CLOM_g23427 [Closterium sp. NIES-68]
MAASKEGLQESLSQPGTSEPASFTVSASLPEATVTNGPPIVHMPVRKPQSLSVGFAVPEEEKQGAAMWQVYVLGAYLIGTWLWAKIKERRREKPGTGDEGMSGASG